MSARIFRLDDYRHRRTSPRPAPCPEETGPTDGPGHFASSFHFWSGASGRRYVHTVYPLVECPDLPTSNFVLVQRDDRGRCRALAVGRLTNHAPSLNLAEIRHRGALLGATEVHVHLLAEGKQQMKIIEHDVRSGQFATGEPASHH